MYTRHWQWWEVDEFLRSNHWVAFDRTTQLFINNTPAYLNEIPGTRIWVDLTLIAHKTLLGFILRGDRGIVVIPTDPTGSQTSEDASADLSSYAYYLYRELRIPQIAQEVVSFGLRRSIGAVKVYWNEKKNSGDGGHEVEVVDPFDLWFPPTALSPYKCDYMIHTMRRTLESIRNNPNYTHTDQVFGDNLPAAATARALELDIYYPTIGTGGDSDTTSATTDSKTKNALDTAIVYEMYEKRYNGNKTEIWVSSVADGITIREPEKTEFDEYPFVYYQTDHHPQEIYGQGAMMPLIPVNRVIDRIESQIADYNNTFIKGAYITEKGSNVRVVNNKSGRIYQMNRGFKFEQMPMAELPDSPFKQLENWIGYHQQISGINQAMVGDKPPGTRTGVEIEALQEAGTNNLTAYIQNYNYFLEDLYTALFKLTAKHYKTTRSHPVGNLFNNLTNKKYIGSSSKIKDKEAIIVPDNVHVTISPDNLIGYTQSARFERIMQLSQGQNPIFDQQAVLELLAINGYRNIITRMEQRKQQEQQQAQQQQQQQTMLEQQAKNMPTPPKVNINVRGEANPIQTGEILETQGISSMPGTPPDVGLAHNENQAMMQGVSVPPTPNASPAHILQHLEHMKTPDFKNAKSEEIDQRFVNHILGEHTNQQVNRKREQDTLTGIHHALQKLPKGRKPKGGIMLPPQAMMPQAQAGPQAPMGMGMM